MTFHRAFSLAVVLAALVIGRAAAQDGVPGHPGLGSVWPMPQQTPAVCLQVLANREETQKHGRALQVAGREKAPPEEICRLFKAFLAAEARMLEGLEAQSATCGVPTTVIEQVKTQHNKAEQVAKQVCALAARPARIDAPASLCRIRPLVPGVPCVD